MVFSVAEPIRKEICSSTIEGVTKLSHIFPRHTAQELPFAEKGDGVYIIDNNGNRYLDASGGAAVSCLGHSDDSVNAAIKEQLDKIAFAHTGFFTSEPAEKLADILIEHAPGGLDRVYLLSGGSESTEAALKLARQYHLEKGDSKRTQFIARKQSYHGNTLGALAAGGNMWRRQPFEPMLVEMAHISPCYEYRGKKMNESSEEYGQRVANELEVEIVRLGPESVAGFIAEPVVGATIGAVPSVSGYFERIRQICDKYGVLLILDEVMCGMGRTGHLYACEADDVAPDILCIAKGLGAGYQPIGAMLCTSEIYERIENGSGFFQHGHTYMGHPVAAAAGHAVVSSLIDRKLVDRCKEMGMKLETALSREFGQHPYIGDIRGRGLFWGIELVSDRETKEPFDPALKLHAMIKETAFENGLICYPMGGTIDGKRGDHVLLAPPFIIEDDQLEVLMEKLVESINSVLASAGCSV